MQSSVELPWPAEPALCPSCQRWVGRGRATSASEASAQAAGADAPAGPGEPQVSDSAPGRKGRRRGRPGSAKRRRSRERAAPGGTVADEAPAGAEPVAAAPAAIASDVATDAAAVEDDGAGANAAAPQTVVAEGATTNGDEGASATEVADADPESEAGAAGNGAVIEAPADDGQVPAEEVEAPAPAGESEDASPEHTAPFPVLAEEPKGRRRLPFLRRKAPAASEEPPVKRSRREKLMRAVPIMLLVVGALLLAEAAITVLWKEPISALLTASGQGALGDDLEKMEEQAAAEAAKNRKQMVKYQRRAAVKLNRDAGTSEALGRLRINKIGLNMVVVQGVDEEVSLKKGPGHYPQTPLPGQKGNWTVGIAGHRTTYDAPFRRINELKRGNKIIFTLPYGRFTYSIEKTRIVDAGYQKAFVPHGKDMIVLTACHPLYSAAQRILVYGKLTKTEARGKARRAARA